MANINQFPQNLPDKSTINISRSEKKQPLTKVTLCNNFNDTTEKELGNVDNDPNYYDVDLLFLPEKGNELERLGREGSVNHSLGMILHDIN